MVGPNFHSPAPPQVRGYTESSLPRKTTSTPSLGKRGKAQYFAAGKDIPAEWWHMFHSKTINDLVNCGLANSPNLAAAKAALRQAQENLNAQVGSLLLPAISAQVTAVRQGFSAASLGNDSTSIFNFFNPGFNISYTLDTFGGSRRQIEAYRAQVDYQAYELEAAYLTLTSNIVTTAINAASLRGQIRVTQELVAAQTKTLDIMRLQLKYGATSGIEVYAQESQVAQIRATLPPLQQALSQSLHLLAVLLGTFASESQIPILDLDKIHLPVKLPISLPSRLAHQRPDVRASEALLHVASAQVGVATANLFPQITLTGSYGWAQDNTGNLFSPANNVWSFGGQIIQPIFYGGSLRAKRRASIAGFEQAAAQYQQTVLQAFQNVADVLRAIENDAKTLNAEREAEVAAGKNYTIAREQFKFGNVSYLVLLTAQRQYQQSSINRIRAQAARYNDTVALFQALGGGWWNSKESST